ncbi:MAG: calcineurin-like phosphoesterase C-terminal domain-containing protein [Balneolales bacterium]
MALLILISPLSLMGQTSPYVEGMVCEDVQFNGVCDPDKPGISDIMVSNQREVVRTDSNGRYRLPIEEDMIIFITKPSGYDLPLNEENLPQFYYIHQPKGSPELEYQGIEPTGSLPESVDFALISSEFKSSFTATILTDPTLQERVFPFYRDGIISEIGNSNADLTIVIGDMMANDLSHFPRYNKIMATLDTPVYNIVGNHDVNFNIENRYAKETFKSYYGPSYFSFDYGDVHFISLDNIDMVDEDGGAYRGYLNKSQLEWVKNDLQYVSEDKLLVLLAHIPLYSGDTDTRSNNTVNRRDLYELLDDRDRVLFLCGHRHVIYQHFLDEEHGRKNPNPIHHHSLGVAAGSWWRGPENKNGIPIATMSDGVPNGYHIFTFEGNTYKDLFKPAGLSKDYQMRIEMPDRSLTVAEVAETDLIVNVFNGTKYSFVGFRINDNSEWIQMEQQQEYQSPFVERSGWMKPNTNHHIWKASLPLMDKGVHRITVWTRDMYGQEFKQNKILEIE